MSEKEKPEYKLNHDTLVTFGEEAYTMRKDDPRTEEAIKKSKELKEAKMRELIKNGASLFEGINMSDQRGDDETFEEYKNRRTTNNNLKKVYKKLGAEECRRQFPMGFNYALQQAVIAHQEKAVSELDDDQKSTLEKQQKLNENKDGK